MSLLDIASNTLKSYLLLAKESNVEIYSTSTSLLVRLLAIGYHSSISGYAFSTTHHNILYVSTFSGLIYKWNWIEGKKIARWDISSQIANLGTAASTMTESDEDIVYTIDKKGKWTITAHKLMAGDQASKTQLVTLYRSPQPISGLRVVEGGRALIATSENLLMIGVINGSDRTSLISTTYVWRQVTLPEWITCFDVRVAFNAVQSIGANSEKLKSRNSSFRSSIEIVAGGAKGEIYIYKDLLEKLIQKERLDKTGRAVDLAASLQHWHREAVSTVKWSLDGKS